MTSMTSGLTKPIQSDIKKNSHTFTGCKYNHNYVKSVCPSIKTEVLMTSQTSLLVHAASVLLRLPLQHAMHALYTLSIKVDEHDSTVGPVNPCTSLQAK